MTLAAEPQADTAGRAEAILRAAGRRMAERVERILEGAGTLSRGDALGALETLVECVSRVLAGTPAAAASATLIGPAVHLRLIDALVEDVVGDEVSASDAVAVLDVVRALRSVRHALRGEGPEDLRSRLTEPDAFELLVEVAHDLRSPLTSILFLSEALRGGHSGSVNDLQRSQLGLIYSAALGLASISSDIVDLARDGRGLIEGEREPYSVSEVFRGVEDLLRPMAEEKRIELRVSVQEFERSFGHPIALGRVLLNLTSNALKFTDHGFVEMGARRRGRRELEYYVRDTGRGISPERRRDLFQPFKARADDRGQFFSGSGVGLTIARRLVRGMGSELDLETAPDWGTRFSFVLDEPLVQ